MIGIFNLVSGLVLLVASIIAGAAWDLLGSQATFLIGGGFALLTGLENLATKDRLEPQN